MHTLNIALHGLGAHRHGAINPRPNLHRIAACDVARKPGRDFECQGDFARSHAPLLGIDEKDFERDIHIHVPAGAIPKDGPSAGIAMASAVASALSRRAVRNDVAMTGEITLSGRVLPIGGLKEKILGAVRAGITRIVIPRDNEPDLEDLSQEVRDQIEVFPVTTLAEALAVTLRDAALENGRLTYGAPSAREQGESTPQ